MIDDNLIIQIEEVEKEVLDALENGKGDDSLLVDTINNTIEDISLNMDLERLSQAEQTRLMSYKTELVTLRAIVTGRKAEQEVGSYDSIVNVMKDRFQ